MGGKESQEIGGKMGGKRKREKRMGGGEGAKKEVMKEDLKRYKEKKVNRRKTGRKMKEMQGGKIGGKSVQTKRRKKEIG